MTLLLAGLIFGTLLLAALFSGAETGVYSVSRLRLEAELRRGSRAARLIRTLLENDTGFLITLLVGVNLTHELLTYFLETGVSSIELVPSWARELLVAVLLTPVVFLLGDVLPKDSFRRRPYLFLRLLAPILALARVVLLPIVWPLEVLSRFLERLFGVGTRDFARALGREEVIEVLEEGTKTGVIAHHARELAQNVLVLRHTRVVDVMTSWERVQSLDLDSPESKQRSLLESSEFTRLPVVRTAAPSGKVVAGYVHQIEVLVERGPLESHLRPIPAVAPDLTVDEALARLRLSGQRLALVGTPEHPQGLVTVMDLVTAISVGAPARVRSRRAPSDALAATSAPG